MLSWRTKVKISAVLCVLGSMGGIWFSTSSKMSSRQSSTPTGFPKDRSMPNRPSDNMGRIYLRRDCTSNDFNKFPDSRVTMFAPSWIQDALKQLGPQLTGATFQILSEQRPNQVLGKLSLKEEISLLDLHKVTRNEPVNTSGDIQLANYQAWILDTRIILTLKDLIRQCVIVGIDTTTGYGGYYSRQVQQTSKVYLCDLAGLQFQAAANSGRLVLIAPDKSPYPRGLLDDFIYQQVVGEKKPDYGTAEKDTSGRYVAIPNVRRHGRVFFDTHAYKRFVANDVILCGIALDKVAMREEARNRRRSDSPQAEDRCSQDAKHLDKLTETKETTMDEQSLRSLTPQLAVQTSGTEPEIVSSQQTADADAKQGSAPDPGVTSPEAMDVSSSSDQTHEATPGQKDRVPEHKDAGQSQGDVVEVTGPPSDGEILNFKFLSYGAGFFAAEFVEIIRRNILSGVIDGLEKLFQGHQPKHIKALEFPFYEYSAADIARLEKLKETYGVSYRFSQDDALKDTVPGLITATTNCADPHAATGNEMGYSSVDAAIATNLASKGNIFSPLLNPEMKSEYVVIHAKSSL